MTVLPLGLYQAIADRIVGVGGVVVGAAGPVLLGSVGRSGRMPSYDRAIGFGDLGSIAHVVVDIGELETIVGPAATLASRGKAACGIVSVRRLGVVGQGLGDDLRGHVVHPGRNLPERIDLLVISWWG